MGVCRVGVSDGHAKRMDIFGVLIVAFGTSFAGGTIRDVLINRPVFWLHNETYLYILFISVPVAVLVSQLPSVFAQGTLLFRHHRSGGIYGYRHTDRPHMGYSPMLGICLGTLTACFGGVVRDLLCNEIPLIFHREIYATISVVGGIVYTVMLYLGVSEMVTTLVTLFGIIATRFLVVRYKLSMPAINLHDNMPNG